MDQLGAACPQHRLWGVKLTMNRLDALQQLATDAERGPLSFPANTIVALRVAQQLDSQDCHLDKAVRLVQSEPLLAARVVAMANSVALNPSGREITDVRTAVGRLGFRTTRTLAMALATRRLSATEHPDHAALVRQLWEHTAHVAALAFVLARRVTHQDPDAALFAGIMHEVGSFYLLSRLNEFPSLTATEPIDGITELEARVGLAVLQGLAVPAPIIQGIKGLWDGYLSFPPSGFADTLLLADQLAPVESPVQQASAAHAIASRGDIESLIGEDTLSDILRESASDVQSLIDALSL